MAKQWVIYKALRSPYTREVWDLTLQELAQCPRCAQGTYLLPFPASNGETSPTRELDARSLPPLDAAIFFCFQATCLSIYVIVFNEARQAQFEALIPYLQEAGRRSLNLMEVADQELAGDGQASDGPGTTPSSSD